MTTTPAPLTAPLAWASRRLGPLAWATLVSNIVLVVTGGVVRLTDSGLGCPTWPDCNPGQLTPRASLNIHSEIEFGNRLLTYVLVIIAVATVAAAWKTPHRRLSLVILAGIPIQAVLGGISVRTHLNPWVVSFHLVASMAIIALATVLLWRAYGRSTALCVSRPVSLLAWATWAAAAVVIYAGTIVTGAGPHAGDATSKRNGLSVLQVAQLHADLVSLFIGLTVGLLFATYMLHLGRRTLTAVWWLLGLELSQGAIGWIQYFTHVPVVLVSFHMLGAALIAAAVTWALLAVRTPESAGAAEPASS